MEEPKHRLQQARAKAGFKGPADTAQAITSVNQNTLTSHENGNRLISKKAAEIYAGIFGVDAGWILFGSEAKPTPMEIPVVSLVSAGNIIEQDAIMPEDIERWITISDLPSGNWLAFGVMGDSMNRIAPNGSLILINREDNRLVDQRFYIFYSPETGAATFKQYRKAVPPRMQPYSTNPEHISEPLKEDMAVFARVRRVITDV